MTTPTEQDGLRLRTPDRWRGVASRHAALLALTGVLLVVVAVTAGRSDVFLTLNNLRNIALQVSVLMILASAMTLLMVSGGIDLSVGSSMSLTGVTMASIMAAGAPAPIAIVAGVCLATAVGALNGVLAAWSPAHPFIITLGTSIGLRGVALLVSGGLILTDIDPALPPLGTSRLFGLPLPVLIALAVVLLVGFVLRFTVFGRRLYALGGNESASRLSGVRIKATKVGLYALSGSLVGIASVVLMARIISASADMGTGYELTAIAAVAVGGVPLSGGRGGIAGTVLGVVLLGTISNSLNLLGVPGAAQYLLQGAVIVVAVMTQRKA